LRIQNGLAKSKPFAGEVEGQSPSHTYFLIPADLEIAKLGPNVYGPNFA
jgi:hypothetical protein